MKLKRVIAISKKEFIQIKRDRLSLAIAFLMPLMQLILYGYAITFDVNNISLAIYDRDKGSLSRQFIDQFSSSGYFNVVAYIDSPRDIDRLIERGKAKVVIAFSEDFSKRLLKDNRAEIGVFIDGSDSNTATIAEGYITSIKYHFEEKLQPLHIKPLIDIRSRVWFNPELKSRNFIIPGLIAIIMSVIVSLLTSLTIAREWERGTMEQLISTPVKSSEIVVGKLIPYFFIGFADMILCVLLGLYWFKVPMHGSIVLLFALSGLFLFGGISLGILISINARGSQIVASQAALVSSFLPALLLSGFMFAIYNMPEVLQALTYLVPARHFVSILKGIFLKGSGLDLLFIETILLSLFALLVFTLAIKRFKKRLV